MSDLDAVQVGDFVLYEHGGFGRRVSRSAVTRTTETRVMIQDGGREIAFRRQNGREVGAVSYSAAYARPWDDTYQPRVDESEAAALREWLRGMDFRKVSLAKLHEAVALLRADA